MDHHAVCGDVFIIRTKEMIAFIVIILLIFAAPYIWRWLQPYFLRWAQRRAENYMRQAMGMPPRDKKNNSGQRSRQAPPPPPRGRRNSPHDEIIPKEYAEDVEFTEFHSYSEDTVIADSDGKTTYRRESQVSDAEIIEIKKKK